MASAGDQPPRSLWRGALRAWRRVGPQSRTDLRELLTRLDGQQVELQGWSSWHGPAQWRVGILDASSLAKGVVEFTYATGEREGMMISDIAYLIDSDGNRHGPFG